LVLLISWTIHVQAFQVSDQIRMGFPQTFAGEIGLILAAAFEVLGRDLHGLEISAIGKASRVKAGIGRQFRHRHHRQFAPHDIAFKRIVIGEHERIHADVEPFRDLADVARLVRPIGDETCDVAGLEHHVRMLVERRQRVGLVILRAHCQNDAASGKIAGVTLEGDKGLTLGAALTEPDAFQPVITDDAAPQRVVEVEHQAFRRPALLRRDQPQDQLAIGGDRGGRDLLLSPMPQHGVVPVADPVLSSAIVKRQNIDAIGVGQISQARVDPCDQARGRSR
jgi:hypothetical protein